MRPRVLLPLLLCSACAAPPSAPPTPAPSGDARRQAWVDKTRAIPSFWGRKDLDDFASHLDGGGFGVGSAPTTYFDLYALDETFTLYVVWKDEDVRKGIRSTEVLAFQDLKDRIDPALYDLVLAIHRSPSAQRGLDFDPVRLIRAVNALQPLGKERALKALREYVRLAEGLAFEDCFKYQIDGYRVLPIARLLFENPPPFVLGAGDVPPPAGREWPLFPMALVQDVPFMLVSGYMLAGKAQSAQEYLRLLQGSIREAPLSPRASALEAADDLTQSDAWKALHLGPGNEGRKRWQVRGQALGALRAIFARRPEEISNDCCVDPTEPQWRSTVDRAKAAGILWSPELQDFIIGR
jgi:hypothetical protein